MELGRGDGIRSSHRQEVGGSVTPFHSCDRLVGTGGEQEKAHLSIGLNDWLEIKTKTRLTRVKNS